MAEEPFDFDAPRQKPGPKKTITKTTQFKDDPREPSDQGCEHYGCGRRKNLWPWEFDEKTIWLCWPHYRRYKNRIPAYRGRMKHHDYAVSKLAKPDYSSEERTRHRDFAKRYDRGEFLVQRSGTGALRSS